MNPILLKLLHVLVIGILIKEKTIRLRNKPSTDGLMVTLRIDEN